ncbi:MAG: hypothetical protein HKK67_04495 [Chlorobiaceae bacterium]|nr:hypothetical protein [Chlorobiaceae bacterium]
MSPGPITIMSLRWTPAQNRGIPYPGAHDHAGASAARHAAQCHRRQPLCDGQTAGVDPALGG